MIVDGNATQSAIDPPSSSAAGGDAGAAPNQLGRLLRALRERALLTQEELAARSGVSVGTIAGLESGRTRRPRTASLRLLADALSLRDEDRSALRTAAGGGPVPARDRTAAGPVVVPAQLPPDLAEFTGRQAYVKRLDELLPADRQTRPASVVISAIGGTAGIGKTTLAVHWAHRVASRFPDGQLYVNLRGFGGGTPVEPAEAVRGFLEGLGVPPDQSPASLDGQVGLYRSLLAGRRVLIVLDNARDSEQVRPLLPGSPGCLVIVTSRNLLAGLVASDAAQPVHIDLPSLDEARQLLERRLGRERIDREPAAVDEIIARCARLPLALAIVAARAVTHPAFPLHALAVQLHESAGGLDAFASGDAATDLRVVLSWSYRRLSDPAARLFRLLGLHPGPDIAAPAAASLVGGEPARVRSLLTELVRAQLLTEHAPGRYTFHDLLRAYAAELAHEHDPEPVRRAALGRLFDHYLQSAATATMLVSPERDAIPVPEPAPGAGRVRFADRQQAMAWFLAEQPALLAAIEYAAGHGYDDHAWRLTWAIANVLYLRGQWHAQVSTHRLAFAAAERLGDPHGVAHIHQGLAGAYAGSGRYRDARRHFRRALDRFRELGAPRPQATVEQGIGWSLQKQGRHREALAHQLRAIELYRAVNDQRAVARVRNNIGWQYANLGEYGPALEHCQRALALLRDTDDLRGQGTALDSLGYIRHRLGDRRQAIAYYEQALDRFRAIGDRLNEAETLERLGETRRDAGEPVAARRAWQQAVTILDELRHPDAHRVRGRLTS